MFVSQGVLKSPKVVRSVITAEIEHLLRWLFGFPPCQCTKSHFQIINLLNLDYLNAFGLNSLVLYILQCRGPLLAERSRLANWEKKEGLFWDLNILKTQPVCVCYGSVDEQWYWIQRSPSAVQSPTHTMQLTVKWMSLFGSVSTLALHWNNHRNPSLEIRHPGTGVWILNVMSPS